MRSLCLFFALFFAGCAADAQNHEPGPVTAGPAASIMLEPGAEHVVTLERTTDPEAVIQSDGLVVPARPLIISAQLGLAEGSASAAVQLGPRGGPWRTVAAAVDPPTISPLLVFPEHGELIRIVATSPDGAELLGSEEGPRLTWVTASPVSP